MSDFIPTPLCDRLMYDGETWMDAEGISHESLIAYVQTALLGFCMCHDAAANLRYIRDGLRHIHTPYDRVRDDFDAWLMAWKADGVRIFTTDIAREFFFYWADGEGLTEHGTAIPGWLTDKGKQLLADIEEALQEDKEIS